MATLALRGTEAGLYPRDFQLAFTTAITVALLAALTLWGTAQLDTLVAVRRDPEILQESEATLRAFSRRKACSPRSWSGGAMMSATWLRTTHSPTCSVATVLQAWTCARRTWGMIPPPCSTGCGKWR